MIKLIFNILEIIVFVYLGFATVYIFIFALAGLLPLKRSKKAPLLMRKIAVLIPGYKEDAVIIEVAKRALEQSYPADRFDVVIIADSFKPETLEELRTMPLKLVPVSFDKSTKSKALNAGMSEIDSDYDIAVVLDADNIMEQDFLSKVNKAFDQDWQVVQGHRVAKNMNNTMALLDSVSEEINNHIFRKGHRVLGLSSALIGSGMAFRYDLFKKRMAEIKAIGGFDKELELTMLRDGIKIEYLHDAFVFDEKVQKQEVFENQRRRWLSAQLVYFRRFVWDGFIQLIARLNVDYFDKVYQMIMPPRILLLGTVTLITLVIGFFSLVNYVPTWEFLAIDFMKWLYVWVLTILAMMLSIPRKLYTRKTFLAILSLPWGFWIMLRSLLKIKGANKTFIHTQHGIDGNSTPKSNS
jgi:cellulose synthase/poly-beta-1,6-N-acetylglucosamine synthase-like glycosyltransferase